MNPNETTIVVEYSLVDMLSFMGSTGRIGFAISVALVIAAIVLVFLRPRPTLCRAYTVAAMLPLLAGLADSTSIMMSAFATLGKSGLSDMAKFCSAMAEIAVPFQFGLIGSAFGFLSAALVWMRARDDQPASH
ncbi:hypothetical protein [Brevifollis gellanilyticus]|uniref:Uncharacterized protein n=1 Tax=Brevifollis gellanilyticus TaxID=748831 RepID=A0A512M770_9BACT|nr:hypothetical protein [Brevifollis gellanilyticus]GEP42191.1 hypothetical protein BGE01nite_14820 [Brevifollis gellanilyticus]